MVGIGEKPVGVSNVTGHTVEGSRLGEELQQLVVDPATQKEIEEIRVALGISNKHMVDIILTMRKGPLANRLQRALPEDRRKLVATIARTLKAHNVRFVSDLTESINS